MGNIVYILFDILLIKLMILVKLFYKLCDIILIYYNIIILFSILCDIILIYYNIIIFFSILCDIILIPCVIFLPTTRDITLIHRARGISKYRVNWGGIIFNCF